MGLYKTEGIVLRSLNLSEADKLATVMTLKYGKIKCVAKAARKIKSRFTAALEPLSHINLIYFGKENQTLYRLNHSDIIESFQGLREDIAKLYTGIYFNELVDSMTPEGHREPKIFHLLLNALKTLSHQEELETLRRLFEIRVLAHSGYTPHLDSCMACKTFKETGWVGFNFFRNGIICGGCLDTHQVDLRFPTGTLSYLKKLLTLDIQWSGRLKFPKGVEETIEKITHRLVLAQLGRELKSYPLIKEMAALA